MSKKANNNYTAARYIKTIAELKSISAAAEALGISQPALSAYLKKHEDELGTALFDRSSKPLRVTEAGKAYLEYAEKLAALDRELAQNIADIDTLATGKLSVGGASFFNVSYLPPAVAKFNKEYPNVELEIVDGMVPELTKQALSGVLDLFITPIADEDDRFEYVQMLDEKIFLCVPADWSINESLKEKAITDKEIKSIPKGAEGKKVQFPTLTKKDFHQFEDSTFIILKENQHIGQKLRQIFARFDFEPKHTISTGQTMTSLGMTVAGVGVSLITESSVKADYLHNNICYYLPDKAICTRPVFIAYPKNKYLSKAASEFVNMLKQES